MCTRSKVPPEYVSLEVIVARPPRPEDPKSAVGANTSTRLCFHGSKASLNPVGVPSRLEKLAGDMFTWLTRKSHQDYTTSLAVR